MRVHRFSRWTLFVFAIRCSTRGINFDHTGMGAA
jgi:hypothetical protein